MGECVLILFRQHLHAARNAWATNSIRAGASINTLILQRFPVSIAVRLVGSMELRETLVAFFCVAMIIWTVGFASIFLFSHVKKRLPTSCVWGWCRTLLESCRYFPDSDRARAQMEEKRLQRMRIVVISTLVIFFFNSCIILMNIAAGRERWWTVGMEIAYAILYLVTIAFSVWPSLLTPLMCKLFFSLDMVFIILHVLPTGNQFASTPGGEEMLLGARILLSWATLDPCMVMAWNAVYGAASWWQFTSTSGEQPDCALFGPVEFAGKELVTFCIISALGVSCANGVAAEIRERCEAVASQNECGAVRSLLKAMSDVVIKLDASQRVMEDSPKLAALLLRGSGGEPIRGAQFDRFLFSEEDKTIFRSHINEKKGVVPEVAVPIRLRLRDGVGCCVSADLVHTELEDVVGKTVHLIGIREVQPETDSQASVGRSSEWGADLPPLQPQTMDATAYLDILAQAEDYSAHQAYANPAFVGQAGRGAEASDTSSRRSFSGTNSTIGSGLGNNETLAKQTMQGTPVGRPYVSLATAQTASREVEL